MNTHEIKMLTLEKRESSCAVGRNVNGEAALENCVRLPQKLKTRSTMIPKSVPLTDIHTLVFMQHNPQYSRCGNGWSVPQQMHGYEWDMYTVEYYAATTKDSLPLGRG